MYASDSLIETEEAAGTWTTAARLTDMLIEINGPVTGRVVGAKALEIARFYRDAYRVTGNVRVRLEVTTAKGPVVATSYAEAPDLADLPLSQYELLSELYGGGAQVRPDGDLTAEALVDQGLAFRGNLVHGAVSGRQYMPAGPHTLRWFAYRATPGQGDGWAPLGNGAIAVPACDQDFLDRALSIMAVSQAGRHGMVVRVVGTIDGTALTGFEDADPTALFEVGRTVNGHPVFVTLR